jgi:hypothetical protein
MRPSQVPVRSMDRHGLLFDPGGLSRGSPSTPRQMLRSGTLKPSAFTRHEQATRSCFSLTGPRLSNNFRGSITHPTVLLDPASDFHFVQPAGFATGLVANLCPERNYTSWIAKTNFNGVPTPRPKVTNLTWHDNDLVIPRIVTDATGWDRRTLDWPTILPFRQE